MKKTHKIISLFLALAICIGILPAGIAIAAVDTVGDFTYDFNFTEYTAILRGYNGTAENVTVPSTVSYLGDTYKVTEMNDTFKNNTTVKAVTISDGIISIDYYSFLECTNLTSITIPDSVTEIGYGAFSNCSNLTSITIPDSVKEIGYGAFGGCAKLNPIIIPDSVTEIGLYAFENCTALTSITIPDSITSIDAGTFKNCSNLTSITIPDSVMEIGYGAFMGCTKLTSIKIPDKITSISGDMLLGCMSLTTVTIPEGVTQIGDGAFQDCTGLTTVTIPESVTQIGSAAFWNCSRLTTVTIPESVTQIDSAAFHNCINLTSVTIPQNVTQIGFATFQNCERLTTVTIPDGVTSIDGRAFYNCVTLSNVTIPDSVTSIGNSAFYNCTSLTSVTIPESVTLIDDEAFAKCSKLAEVTVYCRETKPKSGNNVFHLTPALENNNIKYVGLFFIPVPRADTTEFVYNRSEQTYNIPENKNYTVKGNTQTNADTYTVTVSLKDGYTWEDGKTEDKTYTFKILPKPLKPSDFYIPVTEYKYTGSEIRPAVVPALGTFLYTGDFRVNYRNNINAGAATIIITGVNNYSGVVEHEFKIAPATIAESDFVVDTSDKVYTGGEIKPSVTSDNGLITSNDYNVTYSENINTGVATIAAEGKNNFTGKVEYSFNIINAEQKAPDGFIVLHESYAKDADGQINGVNSNMEYRAEDETDYTAINSNVLPGLTPGRYFIRYKARPNYNPSDDTEIIINAGDKRNTNVEITAELDKVYDGNPAEFTNGYIYYGDGTAEIKWYSDVEGTKGSEITAPVNAGTYWVGVLAEGTDRYNPASSYKQFTISQAIITEANFTVDTAKKVYTGEEIKSAVASDNSLITADDFEVTYTDNINAGIAEIKITGKNNFKGTVNYKFEIIKADKKLSAEGLSAIINGYAENNNGIITGVTPDMEYRKEGETTYTPVTGNEITDLENGTYYIRYAADKNHNASEDVKVTIDAPDCECSCHSDDKLDCFIWKISRFFYMIFSLNKECMCGISHYEYSLTDLINIELDKITVSINSVFNDIFSR